MSTDRRVRLSLFVLAALAAFAVHASPGQTVTTPQPDPRPGSSASGWVIVVPAENETLLRDLGAQVWARHDDLVVAGASDAVLPALVNKGVQPIAQARDDGQWIYLLSRPEDFAAPVAGGASIQRISATADLYLFPNGAQVKLPGVKPYAAFRGVPRIGLGPSAPHKADLVAQLPESVAAVNPLVTAIVNGTSQASWFQFVKDLSGENPVTVGGVSRTILTRYSDAMFPTPLSNAYATEYLLERAANWGYAGVRESYTSANSGCGGNQMRAWQNVVITLPGQVDIGQHQQVLFVTHYDTISYSVAESNAYAPGADDAISGGSALLEALRLFKDYAFKNTVKVIFFSGEELGLCGSIAYTRQHPVADMWRVVNMDQTAYDGDLNRLMDVYNWSLANSPQSVALGDAFVAANLDYGSIINPAKIVRDTTHMCQTDHCPFWDVGVAAIAVTEDLHNNDIHWCFDQLQTATCHDTVTQVDAHHPGEVPPRLMFTQDYSWPSEKAAIATVAALAEPLYACPANAPTPSITPGNNTLRVDWATDPAVTRYVVEKASSCLGTFTAIASVPGSSYEDLAVTNGTNYAYRIRTCPTQVSACVAAAPLPGPSVIYQAGSATVLADSGDHDSVPDNCELVTMQVNLVNDGNQDLTNVKLGSVTSSHPGVQLATTVPENVGDLLVGQNKPARFKFYLGRNGSSATCGEAIPFTVSSVSDQSTEAARGFSVAAERNGTSGPLSYGFESDLSGWTVSTGSFTRVAGGAPGSTAFSLHSRNANNVCDAVLSPTILPSATTGMTLWVNYDIETPLVWDRAVVRAVNPATGVKTILLPTGTPYTTTGSTTGLCDAIGSLPGWAGSHTTWSQATFSLSSFAGTPIQIEVRFSTDASVFGAQGFWFDAVQITNATQIACDAQANGCNPAPAEVSPTGDPVPFTLAANAGSFELTFSEVPGATAYHVYSGTLAALVSGAYDHGASPGLCGFIDPIPGDGSVTVSLPGGLPDDAYFLAVASDGSLESIYGTATAGTIPSALSACP